MEQLLERFHQYLFSVQKREWFERGILAVAILGFFIHLLIIYLGKWGILSVSETATLLTNPIAAAYTPFSFILIYEVYLLVYYLPRSITTYISKQYEIISLIIVRRLFKDLAALEITTDWFEIKGDLQFTYDIIASLLLFYLLYLFKRQGKKRLELAEGDASAQRNLNFFIHLKKGISVLLVPVLAAIATYTLFLWTVGTLAPETGLSESFKDINNIFFDDFFSILIIVDVILLLCSFFLTHDFHKVFRNSGFIISTILIRLSFSVDELVSVVLIVSSVAFGLLILLIYNQYEKAQQKGQI
ncbi:MAG: hypothetical protein AAFY98_07140 [Verrucomicrobiota bacterium]